MPTILQFRRGTSAQNNNYAGSAGEITIDSDLNTIRVHDGSTAGGTALATLSATQTFTNKTLDTSTTNVGAVSISEFVSDTVGAMVSGNTESGISVTYQDADNTLDFSLTSTGVTAGSYGSASLVPIITVDAQGRVTAASTTSVAGVSSFSWNSTTETLTIGTADGGSFAADISGMASETYVDTAISNLVNGASAAYDTLAEIQNAMATDAELSAAIAAITIGNATQTISAGSGMTGGGSFTANQTSNSSVTISHADTSTQASLTALTGANVVSDIDVDGFGHVTALATRTMTLADLGYTGATNANYITNNNQLTNGASYITTAGARSALSFAAGSGGYNSTTGVISIPTNNSQITNGAGYITSSASISGNAATATTLQTARTINGVSFNGSANIVAEPYVEDDEATNATRLITFVDNTTAGYKRLNEDSTLNYNPSTGTLAATIFSGTATSARYADLAERYQADAQYAPGTVMVFGGDQEVTVATKSHDPAVAGIVSTDPAYLMNSALTGTNTVAIALTGRVPCMVKGPVAKGSVLVTGEDAGVAQAIDYNKFFPGVVLGKSMGVVAEGETKLIEVAVGRF